MSDSPTPEEIRAAVRQEYGGAARAAKDPNATSSCCGGTTAGTSLSLGYTRDELDAVPEGANLGLGCGNPQAIAALKAGETVLDLGSGGGFDCFLAARQVGSGGTVIGVDMTPDMISLARANASKQGADNVEFRLGEIEHLPVGDEIVDVIISNCVVNLSPDKGAVFREAFRVLVPGGRLAISDVVATAAMPEAVAGAMAAHCACISGAVTVDMLTGLLEDAGFTDIRIEVKRDSGDVVGAWMPGSGAEEYVASATIEAVKPGGAACCGPSCCGQGASA